MVKNIIIFILLFIVILQGTRLVGLRKNLLVFTIPTPTISPTATPQPQFLTKGMKLQSSPLFKYAYKIYPGPLTAAAKNAIADFIVGEQKVGTASARITFIPRDSEDMGQVYLVRPGNSLYFIEQYPANFRDNYAVIVDKNGIVQ